MTMISTIQIEKYLDSSKHIGILILRIFIGLRLLYGVIDNITSWDQMIEFSKFMESHSFPLPIISAIASVYLQFFCSIIFKTGYRH